MADIPMVLPPEEIDRRRAAEEARAEAAAYLASHGVAGYTPAGAPASMPVSQAIPPGAFDPPRPPAAPAPMPAPAGKPSMAGELAKGVAIRAGGMLLGPAGAVVAHNATTPNPFAPQQEPKKPVEYPPGTFDVPAPPPAEEDGDLIVPPGARGRTGVVIPAGMYPHSMVTSKHQGKAVPEEARRALGASTNLELDAAGKERDAAQTYYQNTKDLYAAHMKATDDARVAHEAVQAKRDAIVNQRLAQIDALNKQAQGKPEDLWTDRAALAGLIGAIATGVGLASGSAGGALAGVTAGNMMQGYINQDINAKLRAQKQAGERADQVKDLLGLHLQQLGQEDKAIDASRLAYYDNVLQQMEMYKAGHTAQVSEAKYNAVRADILARRADTVNKLHAQETDDVNQQYTEHWHNAQVVGGVGSDGFAGAHEPGHTVVLPPSDATGGKSVRVGVKEQETAQRLQKEAAYVGRLTDINNRAIELRAQVKEAAKAPSLKSAQTAANARRELLRLEQEKSKLISSRDFQGVLKESEYFRTMDLEVGLTGVDILGDTNKQLRRENEHMTKGLQQSVKAASGSVVKQGFVRDKYGALKKVQLETGKFYEPEVVAPEVDDEVK